MQYRTAAQGGALTQALDALGVGNGNAAAQAFGDAWPEAYGMDVEAEATNVIGGVQLRCVSISVRGCRG